MNCSKVERPYKEIRYKLTIENGVVCNGDLVVPPESCRRQVFKSVHDDVHCGIAATQKCVKLEAWWPGHTRDMETCVNKCLKCVEIKIFDRTRHICGQRKLNPDPGFTWTMFMRML